MSDFNREEIIQVAALIISSSEDAISNNGWMNTQIPEIVDLAEALINEVDSRNYVVEEVDLSKFGIHQNN